MSGEGSIIDELARKAGPLRTVVVWKQRGEWRVDVVDAAPNEIGPMLGAVEDGGEDAD